MVGTPQWECIVRRHCTAMKISDNFDDTTHIHTQKEGGKREKNAHLGFTTRCGVNMSSPPHAVRGICEVPIMQSSLLHHNGPPQQLALEARITSCAQSAGTSYQKTDGISVILFFLFFFLFGLPTHHRVSLVGHEDCPWERRTEGHTNKPLGSTRSSAVARPPATFTSRACCLGESYRVVNAATPLKYDTIPVRKRAKQYSTQHHTHTGNTKTGLARSVVWLL